MIDKEHVYTKRRWLYVQGYTQRCWGTAALLYYITATHLLKDNVRASGDPAQGHIASLLNPFGAYASAKASLVARDPRNITALILLPD